MMSVTIGSYIYSTRLVGRGSYSKVYKGYNTTTDQVCAVKVIDKARLTANLVDRLHEEINLMQTLEHPHIANISDFLETMGNFYIILEFCAGGDLSTLIKKGPMTETLAQKYMSQLAIVLQYLKSKGIVHRDLKPQNILLTKDQETIKLTDFNFAKITLDSYELSDTLCGTPMYMAPELLAGQSYTDKADLWSVGVIMYELLHGITPWPQACNIIDLKYKIDTQIVEIHVKSTQECQSLLSSLLQVDPYTRINWVDFFSNPWLELEKIKCVDRFSPSRKFFIDENYIPCSNHLSKYTMSEPLPIKNSEHSCKIKPESAPEKTRGFWSMFKY